MQEGSNSLRQIPNAEARPEETEILTAEEALKHLRKDPGKARKPLRNDLEETRQKQMLQETKEDRSQEHLLHLLNEEPLLHLHSSKGLLLHHHSKELLPLLHNLNKKEEVIHKHQGEAEGEVNRY